MRLADLAEVVATSTRRSRRSVEPVTRAVFDAIAAALRSGQEVTVCGFGTFAMVEQGPRSVQDFRSGERMTTPARAAPKFTPAKRLLEPPKRRRHPHAWDRDHAATLAPADT